MRARRATFRWAAAMTAIALLAVAGPAAAAKKKKPAPLPPVGDGIGGFALTFIGSFDTPTAIVDAAGQKNRNLLFVAEQGGRVEVLRGGVQQPVPFLDISDRVMNSGEQGLLGIAFHPDYETNRRFYVYYTNLAGDNEVVEFRRLRNSRVLANPLTARPVLYLTHPVAQVHNGGDLQFDARGRLYIAPGDGAIGPNAQDPNQLLGKLLRIDPAPTPKRKKKGKRGKGRKSARFTGPYAIPPDNPFARGGGRPEVLALGLRNPYRFSFDALTGAIAIGDVGQSCREELDYRLAGHIGGANFGWPRFEGNFFLNPSIQAPGALPPILDYDNSAAAASCRKGGFSGTVVVAGFVVRDPRMRHQYGRLLYTDFTTDEIRSLVPLESGAFDDRSTGVALPGFGAPDSFGEGRGGQLFVVSHNGPIYRLDPL